MFDAWPAITVYAYTAWLPTSFQRKGVATITSLVRGGMHPIMWSGCAQHRVRPGSVFGECLPAGAVRGRGAATSGPPRTNRLDGAAQEAWQLSVRQRVTASGAALPDPITHGIRNATMQGMVVTGLMVNVLCGLPLSGWAADRGMPLLWMAAGSAAVGSGLVFAAQAVFALDPFSLAASWVMQVGARGSARPQRGVEEGLGARGAWSWASELAHHTAAAAPAIAG